MNEYDDIPLFDAPSYMGPPKQYIADADPIVNIDAPKIMAAFSFI
jgi:hypothetical protein